MLARVFARKTNATPVDGHTFYGPPDWFIPDDITEVHVNVVFTYDLAQAEKLAKQWEHIAPVMIGGPATGMAGGEFISGMFLKSGYVITSRGCPNRCWFCSVWQREGNEVKELVIKDGWNLLDDNLLACSDKHINAVFDMLERQPERAQFTGGLDASLLRPWHVERLAKAKPEQVFFAYDTPSDLESLRNAGRMLLDAGFTRHILRCYVLIGYSRDTFVNAEKRLNQTIDAGFFPMAMLYRNGSEKTDYEWRKFQRLWARPALIYAMTKPEKRVKK